MAEMSFWDQRYSEEGLAYGDAPSDFLREVADRIAPGGAVCCLGEGEGRNAVYLAGRGLQVTAVDQSSVGLRKAQALAASRSVRITTVTADLSHHDLGTGQWDALVSIWCHLPTALRTQVHWAAVKALRPGGVIILEAYTPDQLRFGTGGPQSTDLL